MMFKMQFDQIKTFTTATPSQNTGSFFFNFKGRKHLQKRFFMIEN
jgi:hypothetical protein